jgi:hypothetical protein
VKSGVERENGQLQVGYMEGLAGEGSGGVGR